MSKAEKVRELLHVLGIKGKDMAELLGVSPAALSRWMAGKQEPDGNYCLMLAGLSRSEEDRRWWASQSGLSARQIGLIAQAVDPNKLLRTTQNSTIPYIDRLTEQLAIVLLSDHQLAIRAITSVLDVCLIACGSSSSNTPGSPNAEEQVRRLGRETEQDYRDALEDAEEGKPSRRNPNSSSG